MNMRLLVLALLFLPVQAGAAWALHQSDKGHWVSGRNKQQHQLIITKDIKSGQYMLVLSLRSRGLVAPEAVRFNIDQSEAVVYPLRLLRQDSKTTDLQLVLNNAQQDSLFNQLVAGLHLNMQFDQQASTDFSLIGFTNTFSDFLIANEVGRLDPLWLQFQDRKQELFCYEVARAMVKAIAQRQLGLTTAETLAELSDKMSDEAGSALPDIIEQAYSIPLQDLPKIPSSRKYEFFKRCMKLPKGH